MVSVGSNLVVMRQYLVWLQLPVSLRIASLLPSPIVSLLLTSLTVHVQGGSSHGCGPDTIISHHGVKFRIGIANISQHEAPLANRIVTSLTLMTLTTRPGSMVPVSAS